jgi:hypothetical protein
MFSRLPGFCLNHWPAQGVSNWIEQTGLSFHGCISTVRRSLLPISTLAPAYWNALTKQILAVLVHVGSVPEEIALVIDLVEDRKALRIGFRLAVEGALISVEEHIVSTCWHKRVWRLRLMKLTHQSHSAITNPVDLRTVLAEFGGRQLALAGDLADGFFDFVHGDCRGRLLLVRERGVNCVKGGDLGLYGVNK